MLLTNRLWRNSLATPSIIVYCTASNLDNNLVPISKKIHLNLNPCFVFAFPDQKSCYAFLFMNLMVSYLLHAKCFPSIVQQVVCVMTKMSRPYFVLYGEAVKHPVMHHKHEHQLIICKVNFDHLIGLKIFSRRASPCYCIRYKWKYRNGIHFGGLVVELEPPY